MRAAFSLSYDKNARHHINRMIKTGVISHALSMTQFGLGIYTTRAYVKLRASLSSRQSYRLHVRQCHLTLHVHLPLLFSGCTAVYM